MGTPNTYDFDPQRDSWEDEGGSVKAWPSGAGSTLPSRKNCFDPDDAADPRFEDQHTLTMLKTGLLVAIPALGLMAVFWSLAV